MNWGEIKDAVLPDFRAWCELSLGYKPSAELENFIAQDAIRESWKQAQQQRQTVAEIVNSMTVEQLDRVRASKVVAEEQAKAAAEKAAGPQPSAIVSPHDGQPTLKVVEPDAPVEVTQNGSRFFRKLFGGKA